MATQYPNQYNRSDWDDFIKSYEEQVRNFVSQGCDFYFNLLWWRAMRCIPLAVFLREAMPEFCRGYMGYLFRYFLNGDGRENYYTDDNGVKVSKYTSDFDGRIKERELAKLIMHKAGEEGEDAWRMRGQHSKNTFDDDGGFGCTRLYWAHKSKKRPPNGGNRDAYKGYQYYMQACIEILNNGCCRTGPDSALRKLGIDTRGMPAGWGEWQTLEQRMWMLYSPNNSGVYSIHFWPETVHMFIRGIQIMTGNGAPDEAVKEEETDDDYAVPHWDKLADPWDMGEVDEDRDWWEEDHPEICQWLVARSIHCFLNEADKFTKVGNYLDVDDLLAACLKSTGIRNEKLCNIATAWINFEYNWNSDLWWEHFGKVGRNTIIKNAVHEARKGTRLVVGKYLENGQDINELKNDEDLFQPPQKMQPDAVKLHELADTKYIEPTVKDIDKKSGRGMTGHIAKHKQTALDVDDLYKLHLGKDVDNFKHRPIDFAAKESFGHPVHRLETIRALVAGDDGAPPILDRTKKEGYTNLHYTPRSARMGTSIEAAHTTITVKRVVHLCMLDHLTAEGIIYPDDDGGRTITNPATGNPWTWEEFRDTVIWGDTINHRITHWIVHNAISQWNDTMFLFAALGDGHFWVDDADGPLEMAMQLGGQRYIFNHGIRKLEQVECLAPLDKPSEETFVQFWANMVFFALFGGLNPYKEYWLPNPINKTVRIWSLAGMWPDWLDELKLEYEDELGAHVSAYINHMMNIQSATKDDDLDIKDSTIFEETKAATGYSCTEDVVNDYFPKRKKVYRRVMKMIEPYVVSTGGTLVRKRADPKEIFMPDNRKWFHDKNPDNTLFQELMANVDSSDVDVDENKKEKDGGWFKLWWQQVFNGQLEHVRQFRTANRGGVLGQKVPPDIIYGVAPLKDKTFQDANTSLPYATLNTIMWPHYTNTSSGRDQDHAVNLKFYKIQLRNVLDTDGKTLDDIYHIIVEIEHDEGEEYLANMYEMALFYQEWHVQTYMFRQVYLDGRDELIGKNCWDGFRAQDRELEKVVRRPCFLKFNDHARQYDRVNNQESVNVGLEPFLLDDEGKRTGSFHRGIESNALAHTISSKKSATAVQRRMTIGFAEQIQRIDGFGENKLRLVEKDVMWGDSKGDSGGGFIFATSIRTPIEYRSVEINSYTSQAKWWKENQLAPMKVKCQPGVVLARIFYDQDHFQTREIAHECLNTGLVFADGIVRHSEMMIGGRCFGTGDRDSEAYKEIHRALWNELPGEVEKHERKNDTRPNDPYFSTFEHGRKPSPLVRMILNYTNGIDERSYGERWKDIFGAGSEEEEDDYLYKLSKLKF